MIFVLSVGVPSIDSRIVKDDKKKKNVRSTALSKAVSSIPTCGYVDRRDKY
jgi:hypothetical protein